MVYQQSTSVVARRVGADTVLVPVRQNVGDLESIYTVNAVGADLWDRLAQPQTTDALVTFLVAEYDVAPEQAAADVQAFVHEMSDLQLLEARNGA